MYAIKNAAGEYFAGLNLSGSTPKARWNAVEDNCVMAYMFTDAATAHGVLAQDDMPVEGMEGNVVDLDSGEEIVPFAQTHTPDEDDEL